MKYPTSRAQISVKRCLEFNANKDNTKRGIHHYLGFLFMEMMKTLQQLSAQGLYKFVVIDAQQL